MRRAQVHTPLGTPPHHGDQPPQKWTMSQTAPRSSPLSAALPGSPWSTPHLFLHLPHPEGPHSDPWLSLEAWWQCPDHSPKQPTPGCAFPGTMEPACGAGRAAVDGGQQPLHLTFDLQPLLIVLLVVLIRRLEDTWAAGHRQLLGVRVVLHLAQRATDEGGPLPGAGEHTRRGSGCAGGSVLGYKEGDPHSASAVQLSCLPA